MIQPRFSQHHVVLHQAMSKNVELICKRLLIKNKENIMIATQQNAVIKKPGKIVSAIVLMTMALLSSQQSYANPTGGYSVDYSAKHNNRYNTHGKNHYVKPQKQTHQNRRYRHKQVKHRNVRYINTVHQIQPRRQHQARVEHYSSRYQQNNTDLTLVGGVIGGVIANEISDGDAAATIIGAVSGVVLASTLQH